MPIEAQKKDKWRKGEGLYHTTNKPRQSVPMKLQVRQTKSIAFVLCLAVSVMSSFPRSSFLLLPTFLPPYLTLLSTTSPTPESPKILDRPLPQKILPNVDQSRLSPNLTRNSIEINLRLTAKFLQSRRRRLSKRNCSHAEKSALPSL